MYVLDKVLAILLLEILPIPDMRPRKSAMMKDAIVERKVSFKPGRMKKKALLYSGSTTII
jgi:hypothetical protein